ncbi:MAG: tetratricopeptide repeat protein, partial [Deltaproteobacteria bacterium]|nr:tetratricopeptide repeat protein [Deltaproteobacteria bacterium]
METCRTGRAGAGGRQAAAADPWESGETGLPHPRGKGVVFYSLYARDEKGVPHMPPWTMGPLEARLGYDLDVAERAAAEGSAYEAAAAWGALAAAVGEAYGAGDPRCLAARSREARCLLEDGDPLAGRAALDAYAGLEKATGELSPESVWAAETLLSAGEASGGSPGKRREIWRKAELAAGAAGGNSLQRLALVELLADSYLLAGQPAEAAEAYALVLEERQRVIGPERPETLRAACLCGIALARAGREGLAAHYLDAAAEGLAKLLAPGPGRVQASPRLVELALAGPCGRGALAALLAEA